MSRLGSTVGGGGGRVLPPVGRQEQAAVSGDRRQARPELDHSPGGVLARQLDNTRTVLNRTPATPLHISYIHYISTLTVMILVRGQSRLAAILLGTRSLAATQAAHHGDTQTCTVSTYPPTVVCPTPISWCLVTTEK